MELEKFYINNQYHYGYDLYKINPVKKAELLFRETLEKSIEKNNLIIGDKIKLIFLYENTNCCTKFCKMKKDMEKTFEFMCNKENFNCIDIYMIFVHLIFIRRD